MAHGTQRIGLVLALLLTACRQEPITFDGKDFEAHGLKGARPAAGWEKVFAVYASAEPGAPPLTGTYVRHGGTLVFKPALVPASGAPVRAVLHQADGSITSAVFTTPASAAARSAATVSAIFPTATEWPANAHKFDIEFSAPMTRGVALAHIRLLDDTGEPVNGPFVETGPEGWSPDMRRLTVLFNPAREGPALVSGKRYTLLIDQSWPAANGQPLASEFRKDITAVAAVRLPADPAAWKIGPPAGRRSDLVVEFPRPMNQALALRAITVEGVAGKARLENHETRWIFTPDKSWTRGKHVLRIDHALEDLAGNRLHQLFDADGSGGVQPQPPATFDRISFTVD